MRSVQFNREITITAEFDEVMYAIWDVGILSKTEFATFDIEDEDLAVLVLRFPNIRDIINIHEPTDDEG